MTEIDFNKLRVFQTEHASATRDPEKKNVGWLSFSVKDDPHHHVYVMSRSDLMVLAHQIEQLFEPVPPPTRKRKGPRS